MNLNEQLQGLCRQNPIAPREEKIREVKHRSREVLFQAQWEQPMNYPEFLWCQFVMLRKRWWVLQGLLLVLAAGAMLILEKNQVRILSVVGCLFTVLVIPELWRNRFCASTQVEAACLYSLRQIYAARIFLLGSVDVLLLTLFCRVLHSSMGMPMTLVLAHFLLPVTITASLCLCAFSIRRTLCGAISLTACLALCGIWLGIVIHEELYSRVLPIVWVTLTAAAILLLAMMVRRTLQTTNQLWEVTIA